MPKLKLTKSVIDAARPETAPSELRDTIIPGFLLKVTPTGRKIFMDYTAGRAANTLANCTSAMCTILTVSGDAQAGQFDRH